MANDLPVDSHEWWIARLWKKLDERTARIQLYDDYYEGEQRLRFTTAKARDTFGDAFRGFADNFCMLVVDAIEERLRIRGFRVTGAKPPADGAEPVIGADPDAMRIWTANDMDAQASMAHVEALVNEESYLIIWAEADRKTPVITAESPFEVIVQRDVASRRKRLAAMKRWVDEDDQHWYVVLYLPTEIAKFRSVGVKKDEAGAKVQKPGFWERWTIEGEEWPLPNPLGIVPVVPLTNGARLGPSQHGTSEIKAAIPLQDAINKTIFDSLIASEFVAYPQRYMVGVTLPKDENDQPIAPFKAGVDRLWLIENAEGAPTGINPVVGQFAQGDLSNYQDRIDGFIGNMAAITKTPQHYLVNPGGGTNLSGETVKALEAPLVSKARRKHASFGIGHQEAMAIALRIEQGGAWEEGDEDRIEVDWWDPEVRTEAQHIDALLKLATLDVPVQQLWKDAGYTPAEIAQFEAMRASSPPPTQPVHVTAPVAPAATIDAATGEGPGAGEPAPMLPAAMPPARTRPMPGM